MMRLYRFTLILVLAAACGVVAMRALGSRRQSPIAVVFSNSDGSLCQPPCLFSVRPGETQDGWQAIFRHPALQKHWSMFADYQYHGPESVSLAILTVGNPRSRPYAITLTEHVEPNNKGTSISPILSEPASIGDILILYGPPDAVESEQDGLYYYFSRSNPVLVARVGKSAGDSHLQATSPISQLVLFDTGTCKTTTESTFSAWSGFASDMQYTRTHILRLKAFIYYIFTNTIAIPCSL
jgi:hypothetical protein